MSSAYNTIVKPNKSFHEFIHTSLDNANSS